MKIDLARVFRAKIGQIRDLKNCTFTSKLHGPHPLDIIAAKTYSSIYFNLPIRDRLLRFLHKSHYLLFTKNLTFVIFSYEISLNLALSKFQTINSK
jgi:hypothetical protein